MSWRGLKKTVLKASVLWLSACSVRHSPPAAAVFRIEGDAGGLYLVPPALAGGLRGTPILFSQILAKEYGFNGWEQYIDLSPGMRLSIQRMAAQPQTIDSYYAILNSGRHGLRLRSVNREPGDFDKRAKYLRLFYQTKFLTFPGQPQRPAVVMWSDTAERLAARTAEARQNPTFSCGSAKPDCLDFPGKTTVSAEIPIIVNQKPRYVVLGSTVREVLRSDRARDDVDIRVLRRYRNQLVPVTWQQKAFVMSLPVSAGDEMSW